MQIIRWNKSREASTENEEKQKGLNVYIIYNISKAKRNAIETIDRNKDIIITMADKGGAVVIMNKADYDKEALRQFNDSSCYETLTADPTETNTKKVKEIITLLNSNNNIESKLESK